MAKKKNTVGCLFYVALVLLLMVIFLFNRSTVQEVIRKTGFWKLLQKEGEAPVEVVMEPLINPSDEPGIEPEDQPAARPTVQPQTAEPLQAEDKPRASGEVKEEGREVVLKIEEEAQAAPPEQPQPKLRKARLFFVKVNGEGAIELKGIIRPVQYHNAPLTATLKSLLQGPQSAEVNQELITLIPPNSRLLNIYIKNNTAFLDFNEAFRFNSLGNEGLDAQLKQIVYTTTEFSNVSKVQILIAGQITNYLSPEGIAIARPLSRKTFRN